jgi:hypothetical protein
MAFERAKYPAAQADKGIRIKRRVLKCSAIKAIPKPNPKVTGGRKADHRDTIVSA